MAVTCAIKTKEDARKSSLVEWIKLELERFNYELPDQLKTLLMGMRRSDLELLRSALWSAQ